ncbi:MAG: hypothetical protein ORN54_01030 [Cyclobacteriaceae bacterium]|nr:hypothetical protein [Cyclobacteriaceae bacterium]
MKAITEAVILAFWIVCKKNPLVKRLQEMDWAQFRKILTNSFAKEEKEIGAGHRSIM